MEDLNAKEKTMIKGFNLPLPLWRDLLSDKAKMEALASFMRNFSEDEKVLRWPAGTGGKTYYFDRELTQLFVAFCLLAGVKKMTIVVNPDDIDGFFKTYEMLIMYFEIVVIEFDNENYLRSHISQSLNGFSDRLLFIINYNKLLAQKAQEKRFKDFVSQLRMF